MAGKNAIVTYTLRDLVTPGLSGVEKSVLGLNKVVIAGAAGLGAAAVAGVGASIKAYGDFEKTLSAIAAVGGPAASQALDAIREKAFQVGRDTAFSASAAGSAMEELLKAGVSVPAVLGGALDATVALAGAAELQLADAATMVANIGNMFSLGAKELPGVADLLAGAANAATLDVTDLYQSLSYVGPVANALKIPLGDTVSAISVLSGAGIKGSQAGTALRAVLTSLASPSKEAGEYIKALGLNVFDARGQLLPLPQVFQELQDKTKGLNDQAKQLALEKIFGREALSAVNAFAKGGAAALQSMTAEMGKTTAAETAAKRLDNLWGSVTILKGSLETLAIMIGSAFGPMLTAGVQMVTNLVNQAMPYATFIASELPGMVQGGIALVTGFVQQNAPLIAVALGLIGLTIATTIIPQLVGMGLAAVINIGLFSTSLLTGGVMAVIGFATSILTTAIPAVGTFFLVLATQGVGAALMYGASLAGVAATTLASLLPANAAAATSFLTGIVPAAATAAATFLTQTIPAALAAAATFVTSTVPSALAAGAAFLTGTIPGALAAANAFLVTLIPAAIAAAATFVTTTVPAALAAGAAFLTGTLPALIATGAGFLVSIIPAAIAAGVALFTTVIPAAFAAGVAFLGMLATGLVAFAGMVVGAIAAGIGVVVAFWPIILIAALIGVVIFLLWRNWGTVWGGITKITGAASSWITKNLRAAFQWIGDKARILMTFFQKAWQQGVTAVSDIVGSGLAWVRKTFGGVFQGIVRGVGKALAHLVEMVGDAFRGILDRISEFVRAVPILGSVIGFTEGVFTKVSNWVSRLKNAGKGVADTFNEAGGGVAGFKAVVSDITGMDLGGDLGQMGAQDLMGMVGGPAGGAAGGGAPKDPMGIWSGTDSKGAWTIDPGTGAKIYDAGSVGALGQENAAAKKAAAEAKKQAAGGSKSALSQALKSGLKGGESIDLAKAFAEAVQVGVDVMTQVAGAALPSPDLWRPKLDAIQMFFTEAGRSFQRAAAGFSEAELKQMTSAAEPLGAGLDLLGRSLDTADKLNKAKLPDLSIFPRLEAFVLAAGASAVRVVASIKLADLEGIKPLSEAFGTWFDSLAKAVSAGEALAKLPKASVLVDATARVEAFMLDVGTRGGAIVAAARKALGEGLLEALYLSREVGGTFGVWFDVLSKVASAAESVSKVNVPSGAPARVERFMLDIALIGHTFVTGVAKAYPPEARGEALALSRDVAGTFSSWFESLSKAAEVGTKLAGLKGIPPAALSAVQGLMLSVAEFGAGLLRGPGYDLTKDAAGTSAALGIARDVFGTIGAGIDAFAKAAGLDLSKATRVTADGLSIAQDNMVAAVALMTDLAIAWRVLVDVERQALFAEVKEYAALIAPVVDALLKASNLGLDKAARATSEQLAIAQDNSLAAVALMVGLALAWRVLADEERSQLFAEVKEYAALVGPVVDAVNKASALGLDKAARATAAGLEIASANSADALGVMVGLALAWRILTDTERSKLFAEVKEYAGLVGPVVDAISKAANLGLDKAARATAEGLAIVEANSTEAVALMVRLADSWSSMDAEARGRLFADVKAYAAVVGPVVDAVSKAADLGLDKAVLATETGLRIAEANAAAALAVLVRLASGWTGMADEARSKLFDGVKRYAEVAGAATEAISKAADLKLEGAVLATAGGLAIAEANTRAAFGVMVSLAGFWLLMEDEARTRLWDAVKGYAELVGPVIDAITKAAGLGTDVAKATTVLPQHLRASQNNVRMAMAAMVQLVGDWRMLGDEARSKLFGQVESYAKAANEAVDTILKAAGLGSALAEAQPVSPEAFGRVRELIRMSVTTLMQVMRDVGADVAGDARLAAEAAGPVLDVVDKVLSVLTLENLQKSALMRGGARGVERQMSRLGGGLKAAFQALAASVSQISIDPAVASQITALVAAYSPLLDLMSKMNGVKIDLRGIQQLAKVPGILVPGMQAAASAVSGAGSSPLADAIVTSIVGALTSTPLVLTGPVTATGPVYLQGSHTTEVELEGQVVQRTTRSDGTQRARSRGARSGSSV